MSPIDAIYEPSVFSLLSTIRERSNSVIISSNFDEFLMIGIICSDSTSRVDLMVRIISKYVSSTISREKYAIVSRTAPVASRFVFVTGIYVSPERFAVLE